MFSVLLLLGHVVPAVPVVPLRHVCELHVRSLRVGFLAAELSHDGLDLGIVHREVPHRLALDVRGVEQPHHVVRRDPRSQLGHELLNKREVAARRRQVEEVCPFGCLLAQCRTVHPLNQEAEGLTHVALVHPGHVCLGQALQRCCVAWSSTWKSRSVRIGPEVHEPPDNLRMGNAGCPVQGGHPSDIFVIDHIKEVVANATPVQDKPRLPEVCMGTAERTEQVLAETSCLQLIHFNPQPINILA